MYKCLECGHIFEEGEQGLYIEKHNLDTPSYEKFIVCPICGGNFEVAEKCIICNGYFLPREMYSNICSECLNNEFLDNKEEFAEWVVKLYEKK